VEVLCWHSECARHYVWDVWRIDDPVCRDENANADDCTDAATGVQRSNPVDERQ